MSSCTVCPLPFTHRHLACDHCDAEVGLVAAFGLTLCSDCAIDLGSQDERERLEDIKRAWRLREAADEAKVREATVEKLLKGGAW